MPIHDDQIDLAELVERGSHEPMRRLMRRHMPIVLGVARRDIRDAHLAEDVAQAVFLVLARRAGSIKPAHLSGWLFRTTRNLAANARKAHARRRKHESLAAALKPELSMQPDPLAREHLRHHLDDALAAQSESDRSIVLLRFVQGCSVADLGEVFQISEDAARRRLERALKRLRRFLSGRGLEADIAALGAAISGLAVHADAKLLGASASAGATKLAASSAGILATAPVKVAAMLVIGAALAIGAGIAILPSTGAVSAAPASAPATAPATAPAAAMPRTMRYSVTDIQSKTTHYTISVSGNRWNSFSADGPEVSEFTRVDDDGGVQLRINLANKTAERWTGRPAKERFIQFFLELGAAGGEPLPAIEIGGHSYPGFSTRILWPYRGPAISTATDEGKVWIDPATKRPARVEITRPGEEKPWRIIENIQFDLPLDDRQFVMTIPNGFEVHERGGVTADKLKPAATPDEAAKLTIIPGAGVGEAKLGMTRAEIEALLGPSESPDLAWTTLEYFSRGLSIRTNLGKAVSFEAAHEDYSGVNCHRFPGLTDNGIGIGATRDAVEKAQGKPAHVQIDYPFTGAVTLEYKGIDFALLDGRVVLITVPGLSADR